MSQPPMRRFGDRNARKLLWITASIVAILGLVAFSTWFTVSRELRRAREAHVEVQHTREIMQTVQKVLSAMQDAETGERGFLVTSQEVFLEPYDSANASLDGLLSTLDRQIRDDEARRIFSSLAQRAREHREFLGQIVSKHRAGDIDGAKDAEAQKRSKDRMDELRALVSRLQAREEALLDARLHTFGTRSRQSEEIAQWSLAAAVLLALVTSVLTARNYHRRRLAEAAYRDQAIRLGTTLNSIADGIVTLNESGSIESWSKGAEALFGYTEDEVRHRNVSMLMPEPHASAHDGYLRRYISTGERRVIGMRREMEGRHKDGHLFPIELSVSEMRLNSRRLFIGSLRDISMRQEVERLKTGFVSTVSHELRTPLTSISGSLGLLAGGAAGALPEKAQRLVDIALSNSTRLVLLINDILDLDKAESGKMQFNLQRFPMRALVQEGIDLNRGHAQSLGVSLELDAASVDGSVYADRDRLMQVLTNLLSNAAKFSPRGGTVRLLVRTEPDNVRVEVRDEGPGIAPEFQKRIFQKFAQGDSSDARAKNGTGLGLSISKTLIERLGGAIGFATEHGKGTTFWFTLPLHRPAAALVTPQPGATLALPNVLLCEDDPDIAEAVSTQLAQHGARVEAVTTAESAIDALCSERFDVAIVDIDLPDRNGLDLISELRKSPATRALPVIVTTARARAEADDGRVAGLGLVAWLEKPVDPLVLVSVIREAIASPQAARPSILRVDGDESLTKSALRKKEIS